MHVSQFFSRVRGYNTLVEQFVIDRLIDLNHQFYQTFALQFSMTRRRIQPGIRRVIEQLPQELHVLDLGCGNGTFFRELERRGHTGLYVGLDFSRDLLTEAQTPEQPNRWASSVQDGIDDQPISAAHCLHSIFFQVDLATRGWSDAIYGAPFTLACAFAVLHHIPGEDLRRGLLREVHQLLVPGGRFIHSEWQFLKSPRFQARIQPWEVFGLNESQVEPGDYLLDWRYGEQGYRYVHYFEMDELAALADMTGFRVVDSYQSDGEGSRLGLYQVWERLDG